MERLRSWYVGMDVNSGRYKIFCLIAAFVALTLAACGKKTMPVPPQAVIPAAITDLNYELDDLGVKLSWSIPTTTEQGERLTARPGFIIQRGASSRDDFCPGCPKKFTRRFNIAAKDGGLFIDRDLRDGYWYYYRIYAKAGWHLTSEPSNEVLIYKDIPLPAPEHLELQAGDRSVQLSWPPPVGRGKITFYQVYRSLDTKTFSRLGHIISDLEYIDKGLDNGTSYAYLVRAINKDAATVAAGKASNIVSGAPRDLTPPPVPQKLRLVAGVANGISLYWQPASAVDLSGYRIYRRVGRDFVLLAQVTANQASFVDENPPLDEDSWSYRLSAIDQSDPANESKPSKEVVFNIIR